ncbi:N-formylglutamate deformylase [Sulfitobacter sp. JB4-11]|uniref:N-formylglutamate deformylase n=1 Tax=Sulfitobacter rhodophyticola TaxID=3238304 RepID=UPI0035113FB9
MSVVEVISGTSPVVLAQPHGGTDVPTDLMARLNPVGQGLSDTDWHIARLYDGLLDGATIVRAHVHRYVIDANRDPAGASLYPGQNTTTLCPITDFDGKPIWLPGQGPSADEIDARRTRYHAPYHAALAEELARVEAQHGVAILYDCHSIRSEIPFLFDGTLPVFNIGTNSAQSCAASIEEAVRSICEARNDFDTVANGRFKGGWTTRNYGQPKAGIHAIQMELAQRAYMQETPPWRYAPDRANILRPVLAEILTRLDHLARSGILND